MCTRGLGNTTAVVTVVVFVVAYVYLRVFDMNAFRFWKLYRTGTSILNNYKIDP